MGPQTELLSAREVCKIAGFSHATLYRLVKRGRFPKPIKIGLAAVRWRADELATHIENLSNARAK